MYYMLSTEKLEALHSDRNGVGGVKVAAVVIVVVIVALAGYFLALNGHHADLHIEVQSTHFPADMEITVYVDGKDIGTYARNNPSGWDVPYKYTFSIFDDSKSIVVKAVSTDGNLGNQSDQKVVLVKNGSTYSVTLYLDFESMIS
jgi:hypothetical protein